MAIEKKSRNKDTKTFLGDLVKTISYLENPQNTKRRGEYQSVAKRDLKRSTNVNFIHHSVVINCEHCYLILGIMKVPLNYTDLPFLKLC